MEIVAGILSLLIIVAFFGIHSNIKKLLSTQNDAYKILVDQNNQLSELITILKDKETSDRK